MINLTKVFSINPNIIKNINSVNRNPYYTNIKGLTKDVFELNEQQSFKPFKTIEEAKKYAKEIFGIEYIDIENLDIANFLLNGIYKAQKITGVSAKLKKLKSVKNIKDDNPNNHDFGIIAATMCSDTGVFEISEEFLIKDIAAKISQLAGRGFSDQQSFNTYMKIFCNMDNGKMPLLDIMKEIKNINFKPTIVTDFPNSVIYHEIWHRLHYLNCQKLGIDFDKMAKPEELKAWNIKDDSITREFLSDKIQNIIKKYPLLGWYSRTSPCEFVAETGVLLANEVKIPNEIMNLYKKYGGPIFSKNL